MPQKQTVRLVKDPSPIAGMQQSWNIIDNSTGLVMMEGLRTFMDAMIVADKANLEVVKTVNGTHIHGEVDQA